MPAQTSLVTNDLGDYLAHVYTFADASTYTVYEVKAGIATRDQGVLDGKLVNALSLLESADTNWGTLTANQKDNAARLTVRVCAAFCRFVLNEGGS